MKKHERNHDIIEKMLMYCDQIDEAVSVFGNDFDIFQNKSTYKNAVSMCIYQIGELSIHLSDDFKNAHSNIPWKQIRGMRNVFAHAYISIDINKLWETMQKDIPALRTYCKEILQELNHEIGQNQDVNGPTIGMNF